MVYNKNIHPHWCHVQQDQSKTNKTLDGWTMESYSGRIWKILISTWNVYFQFTHVFVRLFVQWYGSKHQNLSRTITSSWIFFLEYVSCWEKDMISQIVNSVILDCHFRDFLQWWTTKWISGIHVAAIELFCSAMIIGWFCYWFCFSLVCVI